MAENPIPSPLPADLPTNWTYGQTVAPTGAEAGLATQYGYNYLMAAVNAAQAAINLIGAAFESLPELDGGKIPISQLPTGVANGVASLDQTGKVPASQLPDMNYLPLAGGNMQGAINMGNYRITNLNTPADNQDAATKAYVDAVREYVQNAGFTNILTGNYTGNGQDTLTLTFGFMPKSVLIVQKDRSYGSVIGQQRFYFGQESESQMETYNNPATTTYSPTSTGLVITGSFPGSPQTAPAAAMNLSGSVYYYAAFG